jgi:two-component system osmolarity sensor histidine kinase EnvZ
MLDLIKSWINARIKAYVKGGLQQWQHRTHHVQSTLRQRSLFTRTFLLLSGLIGTSLILWFQLFQLLEREPRAQQVAQRVTSSVNLSRSALAFADANYREALLNDFAKLEGIRIYPNLQTDQIAPIQSDDLFEVLVGELLQNKLGDSVIVAEAVNHEQGLWVSFMIQDDRYWLRMDWDRLEHDSTLEWLGWATMALLLSLIGAAIVTNLVNQPLHGITQAAEAITRGEHPAPLAETGPREVQLLNRQFNHMMTTLQHIETERAMILAGLSHDIRTPLTRLRLSMEISHLPERTLTAMTQDIALIDRSVGQFLDYARSHHALPDIELIDLHELLQEILIPWQQKPRQQLDIKVTYHHQSTEDTFIEGNRHEMTRILINIFENALRYGTTPQPDHDLQTKLTLHVSLMVQHCNQTVVLQIADEGAGISSDQLLHLQRPFTRGNAARSDVSGSGLGLAIIQNLIKKHHGTCTLYSPATALTGHPNGLLIEITLPHHRLMDKGA